MAHISTIVIFFYSPLKRIPVARFPPRLVSFKQKQIELSFRSIDRPEITQFNKTFILGPKIILRMAKTDKIIIFDGNNKPS